MKNECINVLIACECSQVETKAFRRLGFTAYSCDLQRSYGGHPEWHIVGDVLPLMQGRSIFFESFVEVAEAMAVQWGGLVRESIESWKLL